MYNLHLKPAGPAPSWGMRLIVTSVLAWTLSPTAQAAPDAPLPQGYLCCNMRTDGSWISDSNYRESGKKLLAVGTPIKATSYGRYRVYVEVQGSKQALGNDYSRDLELANFAKRYIVTSDPQEKIATYPTKVREAIESARLMKGMTREQTLMAMGYPISSETPNLDAKVWRYWLSSFAEFQVKWTDEGRIKEIVTDEQTRSIIQMD